MKNSLFSVFLQYGTWSTSHLAQQFLRLVTKTKVLIKSGPSLAKFLFLELIHNKKGLTDG